MGNRTERKITKRKGPSFYCQCKKQDHLEDDFSCRHYGHENCLRPAIELFQYFAIIPVTNPGSYRLHLVFVGLASNCILGMLAPTSSHIAHDGAD